MGKGGGPPKDPSVVSERIAALDRRLADAGVEIAPQMLGCGTRETMLERFLLARDCKVEDALKMVKDSVQWRTANAVDASLDEPLPVDQAQIIGKLYPSYFCGFDKMGNIIYLEHTAAIDFKKIYKTCGEDAMIKAHIQLQEFQNKVMYGAATKRAGGELRMKMTNIMDMRGLSISMLTSIVQKLAKAVSKINQDNYPEGLYQSYIINPPLAFQFAWGVIKPFLHANTVRKVKVLGSGRSMYRELREALGPEFELGKEHIVGDIDKCLKNATEQTAHSCCQMYIAERAAAIHARRVAAHEPPPPADATGAAPVEATDVELEGVRPRATSEFFDASEMPQPAGDERWRSESLERETWYDAPMELEPDVEAALNNDFVERLITRSLSANLDSDAALKAMGAQTPNGTMVVMREDSLGSEADSKRCGCCGCF